MPFPRIEITGGPTGRSTKIKVDGEELKGVYRAEIEWDVKDAVRLKTYQFVEALVDTVGGQTQVWHVRVNKNDGTWNVIAESKADTIWQGLYDCGRQLELAARRKEQGVAQAGTMMESSGRPPGG